jgi:cystathionine gamma-synthase
VYSFGLTSSRSGFEPQHIAAQEINVRPETIAIHAGAEPDPSTGSLAPPIHLSTTFEHGPASEELHGYLYVREGNPTQSRLETALAQLEGGERCLVFASGQAAGAVLLQSLSTRAHVIFPDDVYIDFQNLSRHLLAQWQVEFDVVNMQDLKAVQQAVRSNTRLIWTESPSNPLLKIVDIAALAQIAHAADALLVLDNTFCTPVLQRPLEFGADLVLHSTTKYFGGHSDVQGGALISKKTDDLFHRMELVRRITGAVASPFNSWLVLRGIRSLFCRMEKHSSNGMAVAQALKDAGAVKSVHYPGLEFHPGHEIARRQMKAFGGMLSFQMGSREAALRVASRVKLFTNATSLGGVESLLEHRASCEGPGSRTPDDLLRISVGLEHEEDLIADLRQAML